MKLLCVALAIRTGVSLKGWVATGSRWDAFVCLLSAACMLLILFHIRPTKEATTD